MVYTFMQLLKWFTAWFAAICVCISARLTALVSNGVAKILGFGSACTVIRHHGALLMVGRAVDHCS